jgi:hypothetical protein
MNHQIRCDNGISLEQQDAGEFLQYPVPLRNTESLPDDYTQPRDDEYASNRVTADAWLCCVGHSATAVQGTKRGAGGFFVGACVWLERG